MRFLLALVIAATSCLTLIRAAEPTSGWRGNRTGLWPEAQTPIEWSRIPQGAIEGLRCRSNRPADAEAGDSTVVEKGLIREWLVLGPYPVADSEKNFDDDVMIREAFVTPTAGLKAIAAGVRADLEWKPLTSPADDPMAFGTAEVPWLDVGKAVGFKINQLAYAHTHLFSPRGGPARIVVDHGEGLSERAGR